MDHVSEFIAFQVLNSKSVPNNRNMTVGMETTRAIWTQVLAILLAPTKSFLPR